MKKANGKGKCGRKKQRRPQFSKEEDEKLLAIVEKYGANNWHNIGIKMKSRTGRQCRDRYQNYLRPGCNNDPWTPEEEELLKEKVHEIGSKWSNLASFFRGRTGSNIKNHWNFMCRKEAQMRLENPFGDEVISLSSDTSFEDVFSIPIERSNFGFCLLNDENIDDIFTSPTRTFDF